MDIFLGISKDSWDGVFSVAKVLIPGLILTFFVVYYQVRKTREMKLWGAIAKVRIQSYERIVEVFSQLFLTVSPTLREEEVINKLSKYVDYQNLNTDYPKCTGTEKAFDVFYQEISDVLQNENIYIDQETKNGLEKSVAIFTHCKLFLDAYCDTERFLSNGSEVQDKIDFAYMMTSIMMKSQYNRAFIFIEDIIGRHLRHHRISYKKYFKRNCFFKLYDAFLRILDRRLYSMSAQSVFWRIMPPNYKEMVATILQFPDVFNYIHFMDKYTPDNFFQMDEGQQTQLKRNFSLRLYANLHR